MSDASAPAWVTKRDGRLVPFEADKISRALFAAGERLGRPDAFLARELTDGVVHFLSSEAEGAAPTTGQVADLVTKVVRELGQPALAQSFAEGAAAKAREGRRPVATVPVDPGSATEDWMASVRAFTLRTVFARDLVAAQDAGLLKLTGLEAPLELAGRVLEPDPPDGGLLAWLAEARPTVGGVVALDSPEYTLGPTLPSAYARELTAALGATGLRAVVNLNAPTPPSWADSLAAGPLFPGQRRAPDADHLAAAADALLECLVEGDAPVARVRIDWHLGERDFAGYRERLVAVSRRAMEGAPLAFVFDRPRRPLALAEGMDRRHGAVLLTVGLHLPRLAEQPGVEADPSRLLTKLGSLARLALSAATQKRDFLRRVGVERPALLRGFLLGRARLIVAPLGLETLLQAFPGMSASAGLDFTRQIIERLQSVLTQDGQVRRLETCLDAPAGAFPADASDGRLAAGLTARDATAPVKGQLQAAGALHAVAGSGTALVHFPEGKPPSAGQVADWLRWAWQQTDVIRLRFLTAAKSRQMTLPASGA